jgi:hypothetical protein
MATLTKEQIIHEWAAFVIRIWQQRVIDVGIKSSSELARSFTNTIYANAGGDTAKIEYAFNWYGKLADMGVGRGTKLEQVGQTKRQRYPWFSTTFLLEVKKLANMIARFKAEQATIVITESWKTQ